jgi:hypothetical protein
LHFGFAQELDTIDADMKKAKNLLNLFELESRSIPPAERNLYKSVCPCFFF